MFLHWLHILVATAENTAMLMRACRHPLDLKNARDVRLSAACWDWAVGLWIPLYALVYRGPRLG